MTIGLQVPSLTRPARNVSEPAVVELFAELVTDLADVVPAGR